MIYGISAEAPRTFQTPFTIVHQNTYVSPYLEFETEREQSLPRKKASSINPTWKNKINLQHIEVILFLDVGAKDCEQSNGRPEKIPIKQIPINLS